MADLVLFVGSRTAQGARENNEDNFVVDMKNHLFVVADGMGGQEGGEQASTMAVEIIPKIVEDGLASQQDCAEAIQAAMTKANQAIVDAGKNQPAGHRMGTTAVLAQERNSEVTIGNLGDSRAYLIRDNEVKLLTVDHSVAQALVMAGALTPEEAKESPYQHVLHKFLGCAETNDGPDILSFKAQAGDRLLLATDGLTNHITDDDLREGAKEFPNVQAWSEQLVDMALERGSKDNVTCIVLAFEKT
ncbi:MAG: PP2C family protein-serine/threonine phosphatase [Gemmataceae bacterium]